MSQLPNDGARAVHSLSFACPSVRLTRSPYRVQCRTHIPAGPGTNSQRRKSVHIDSHGSSLPSRLVSRLGRRPHPSLMLTRLPADERVRALSPRVHGAPTDVQGCVCSSSRRRSAIPRLRGAHTPYTYAILATSYKCAFGLPTYTFAGSRASGSLSHRYSPFSTKYISILLTSYYIVDYGCCGRVYMYITR